MARTSFVRDWKASNDMRLYKINDSKIYKFTRCKIDENDEDPKNHFVLAAAILNVLTSHYFLSNADHVEPNIKKLESEICKSRRRMANYQATYQR